MSRRPHRVPVTLPLATLNVEGVSAQRIPASQHGSVTQRVGATDIAVSYNRPVARGRRLFGELVRWGRIWHPGADSATTITFSRDVTIAGHDVAAGPHTPLATPRGAPQPFAGVPSRGGGRWGTPSPGAETRP